MMSMQLTVVLLTRVFYIVALSHVLAGGGRYFLCVLLNKHVRKFVMNLFVPRPEAAYLLTQF